MAKIKKVTVEDLEEVVVSKDLVRILGDDEESRTIKATLNSKVHASHANYRCYKCNGSGKLYSPTGKLSHDTNSQTPVRFDECPTCDGTGLVDYHTSKSNGWLK